MYWYAVGMRDARFEWDDAKAAANRAKHGVTFDQARRVFDDPLALELVTHVEGEERSITIGMAGRDLLIVVVSADRLGRIRIISARRATRLERQRYEDG